MTLLRFSAIRDAASREVAFEDHFFSGIGNSWFFVLRKEDGKEGAVRTHTRRHNENELSPSAVAGLKGLEFFDERMALFVFWRIADWVWAVLGTGLEVIACCFQDDR